MHAQRMVINTKAVIPLMAALPYAITMDEPDGQGIDYDPRSQLTVYAGRGFSTSREDESTGEWFKSRSDTKKDD